MANEIQSYVSLTVSKNGAAFNRTLSASLIMSGNYSLVYFVGMARRSTPKPT
jgi:hypothetical protein